MKVVEQHSLQEGLRLVNPSGNGAGLLFQSKVLRPGVSNAVKYSY